MSKSAQYQGQRSLLQTAQVITSKPTHIHRGSGARHAQGVGVDVKAIEQHGHWNHDRVWSHYLSSAPTGAVAFKMAGFKDGLRPWHRRNCLTPPVELQRQIFPFIESYFQDQPDWLRWTENVMMDRDTFNDRPSETRMKVLLEDCFKIRILLLLTHLRKVILQDAVILWSLHKDVKLTFEYWRHHIFSLEVFKSPLFTDFKADLVAAMARTTAPETDSVHAMTPVFNSHFKALRSQIEDLGAMEGRLGNKIEHVLQLQDTTLRRATGQLSGEIAEVKRDVATISKKFNDSSNTINALLDVFDEFTSQIRRAHMPSTSQSSKHHQHSQRQEARNSDNPTTLRARPIESAEAQPIDNAEAPEGVPEVQLGRQSPPPPSIPLAARLLQIEHDLASPRNELTPEEMAAPAGERYIYSMIPQARPLRDHWKEWFHGIDGNPSIWRLDKYLKSKWRSVPGSSALNRRYKFKKDIVYSILRLMLEMEGTLTEREDVALRQAEITIGQTSLNQYYIFITNARKGRPVDIVED